MIAASLAPAAEQVRVFTFRKDDLGKVPAGWAAAKTGQGDGSVWKIVADPTAPSNSGFVLAQTAAGPNTLFNLCVAEDTSFKDVEVKVAFKPMKGELDQGGGIAWRYQDANNYYIARSNPRGNGSYQFYKVIDGKRTSLAGVPNLKVPVGEWHTLKIKQVGNQVECYLNDQKKIEAKDDSITKPGKVGLWTKSDAQTYFDGFQVTDLAK
jgi:hypothetical protein